MAVVLVGANPGVLLLDGEEPTAFASVWQVDWSPYGTGPVVVLVHGGRMRVLGADPALGRWLATAFVRHFGEAKRLPWEEPAYEEVEATLDLDLGRGVTARAGDVVVSVNGAGITSAADAQALATGLTPGTTVQIQVERAGGLVPLTVTVPAR